MADNTTTANKSTTTRTKALGLIALHNVQATNKDGVRVDVAPGRPFTVQTQEEYDGLVKAGVARVAVKGEEGFETDAPTTADLHGTPPAGYAAGTEPFDPSYAGPGVNEGDGKTPDGTKDQALDGGSPGKR
jgi:hypothetical protein